MKSSIKIEVNFDEGRLPVIQILNRQSQTIIDPDADVRDRLISAFLQSLQHTSRWCKIIYMGNASTDERDPIHRWQIIPVTPDQIEEEMKLMQALLEESKKEQLHLQGSGYFDGRQVAAK